MSMDIIPLITPSADRLCDIVSRQLKYVTRYEGYYSKLEKGMVKLQAKKEDVVRQLERAKRELKELRKEVLVWLDRFETVEKEWITLMEKRDNRSRCMNGFLPNPLTRRKMSKQILKMTLDVNELYRDGDFTQVADDPQPLDVVPQVTSGTINRLESRELIMNAMMEYLKDDNIISIGVHGMGGIGKTTLMKNINDELLLHPHFKKVIMVTVSKDPDVKKIQVIIAERLGLELKEIDSATRANKLYERLKMEDSILIILDDMWNKMELGELGLRPGTQDMNCKFIITTRNVDVCKQMKVQKTIEMGLLSETESWVLFEEKAGPSFGLFEVQSIAQETVRKCKGSPLAIATIASTLGREDKEFVWKRALSVLQNPSAMGLKGIMPEVVTSLTWSYDHLSNNPDVQLCFLYCSFLPEDSNISLLDLRNYGIAEKFVKGTRTLENASNELLCHVKILKDCGLLLDGDYDETVKMHGVVRDVAIFIADRDQQGLVVNVDGGSGYLPQSEKLETCKRISLIYNEDQVLSHAHPLECPQLKSLMVAGTDNLPKECDNIFKETATLSVLDIRARDVYDEPVMRIPESVSYLKNIQTLYLHGCDIFNKVSMLGGLTKLEVLSMRRCRLGELLEEIGNLTNLRYLDLSNSEIEYVAPHVFSKLTRIEELYMRGGFKKWGRNTEDGTKRNAGFIEVATLPHLSVLEVDHYLSVLSDGPRLNIVFSTEDDEMETVEQRELECTDSTPATTSLLPEITKISLSRLPKLKSICNRVVTSGSLQGLTELNVSKCDSLQYLSSLDLAVSIHTISVEKIIKTSFFPRPPTPLIFESLHCLIIHSCPKLKFLFSFSVARHLNQLHKLSIVCCPGLCEIIGNGEEEPEEMEHNSLLPALQHLKLKQLWRLTSFFKGDLPIASPLKEITIKFCPNFTRFPLKTVSSQTSFNVEGSWFRRLREQDENQTSVFQRFVKQDEPEYDTVHLVAAGLWSDDSVSRHEVMTQIWKILSDPELRKEVRTVIVSAVVLRSIELLNREDFPQLQSEAAWMFANIAPSGYPNDVMFAKVAPDRPDVKVYGSWVLPILVKLRDSPHEDVREKVALALGKIRPPWRSNKDAMDDWVVPIIVKLLSSHQEDIIAQAVLALGNIVGVSTECRDFVLGYGGLTAILTQVNGDIGVSIIRNTTWALCQLFHRKPYLPLEEMKLALPALKNVIHSNDETICSNACEALSVIAADNTAGIQAVIEADVLPRLVELLQHPSPYVVLAASRTIQNIACGDDVQKQCLIDHQVLPGLIHLLNHDHMNSIKVAACWSISDIMHNRTECTQAIIKANIIRPLVHQLETAEFNIKIAAVRAIISASECLGQEGIKHLVKQGCVQPLCDLLYCPDSSTITHCLKGLENILQAGETSDIRDLEGVNSYARLIAESGGLNKIVNLQCHNDTDIQEKAAYILKTYHMEKHTSPIASGVVGTSSYSSPPHGDASMGLVEELEGEGGNILGHDNNETQVEAHVAAFPVAFADSGSALSSSVLHGKAPLKLVEKHDLNSNVGKNNPSEGVDESTSISLDLAAESLDGNDDIWEDHSKDQTPKEEGKDSAGLEHPETVMVHAKASSTKQESRSAPTIMETMKILDTMDMKIGGRIYVRALKLLQEEGWRESFMYMSDARRKDWLLSIEEGQI